MASGVFCDIKRMGTGKGSQKGKKRDLGLIVSEVRAAVASSELREVISAQGFEPSASSPEQFSDVIRGEIEKWMQVVKASGFKAE